MKTKIKLSVVLMFGSLFIFSACGGDGGSNTTVYQQQEQGPEAGDVIFHNADGAGFVMVYVPAKNYKSVIDSTDISTVSKAYWIGETEVPYELWYTVRQWAISHFYVFANAGREGHDGTIGAEPINIEPVTYINWRDAMVWCNAATEWYNAKNHTNYTCVYYSDAGYATPIRTSTNSAPVATPAAGTEDNPYIKSASNGNLDMANCTATGFRLLTVNEWMLAAKYINDINNDGDIYDPGEFYPNDYASGATANTLNAAATQAVTWYDGTTTHAVKDLLSNALGIYDMSGNVWEWCFDISGTSRHYQRGGAYNSSGSSVRIGTYNSSTVSSLIDDQGLRIARTAD